MKKAMLLVIVPLMAALLAIAVPAAAGQQQPVGERIRVRDGSIVFPAGAPFHIMHGWVQSSEDGAIGVFDFALEVDGVLRREDIKMFSAVSGNPDTLWRLWVHNFPAGMTGMHTFTGHWFAPCQYAVENLGYPGACSTPNAKVETATRTLTATFLP
jgi:hypothetical protein